MADCLFRWGNSYEGVAYWGCGLELFRVVEGCLRVRSRPVGAPWIGAPQQPIQDQEG